MCNVGGYVGDQPAAPILLELMGRMEGFAGGDYTGIATVADGKLHHAKVVGDLATLRRETDAERLPGTVGIVHSRTKSGGGVEWGHPFVDCTGRLAYIANGSAGYFADKRDENAVARRLAAAGHAFRATAPEAIGRYPLLADGTCVHTSDVMCHLIESLVDECGGLAPAMRQAFHALPAEIVGLAVHANTPDCVVASRINQPLMIGRGKGGTFLASTAMAFPPGTDWLMPMPVNAAATVRRDGIDILPFDSPPGPVANAMPWKAGRAAMLEALADGKPKGFGALTKATAELWPADMAPQRDMMTYEILRALHREGTIRFELARVPGVADGTTAPFRQAALITPRPAGQTR